MVNFIVPNDRVAPRAYLHPCQRVPMDIVLLKHTTPICKEVHAPLQSPVNLVVLEGRVALPCDPDTCVCVGVDLVFDKLTTTLFTQTKYC